MKIGFVVRAFAKTPELVQGQVDSIQKTLGAISALSPRFDDIDVSIVIPINPGFVDADCGLLLPALVKALVLESKPFQGAVNETLAGLFCGALNEAFLEQYRCGCTYSFVVSTGCADYITPGNMANLMRAFDEGALATGLAIGELERSILEGRLANTFAGYHIKKLLSVGGFDLRCENAFVSNPKKLAGVEEIPSLLRLAALYGKCIKPILPEEKSTWVLPSDPDGLMRHNAKMASKFTRQKAFAEQLGYTLDDIANAVMP